MRIVVHDYSGHAFPVQLSRSLASRGHHVLHVHSSSFLTPQGQLERLPGDPPGFEPVPIGLQRRVEKSNLFKRRQSDIEHGRLVVERMAAFKPDVVISGNTPLDAQRLIQEGAGSLGAKFVFWVQDLIGQAAKRLLKDHWLGAGKAVGAYYVAMENRLLCQSEKVVVISEDFKAHLPREVVGSGRVEVVENWAVLAEIPLCARDNAWGQRHGLTGGMNFLYSGTLGMKHNPELLVSLARELPQARVIVVSEGDSVEYLRRRIAATGLANLCLLPFQPFEAIPEMLATADVLVAVLEPSAGVFSVPSKVLTYLCAGRPLLLAVPPENLAARIVSRNGAGLVSPPDDERAFLDNAKTLAADKEAREAAGAAARAYAERTFDIETVTDKFERILGEVLRPPSASTPRA